METSQFDVPDSSCVPTSMTKKLKLRYNFLKLFQLKLTDDGTIVLDVQSQVTDSVERGDAVDPGIVDAAPENPDVIVLLDLERVVAAKQITFNTNRRHFPSTHPFALTCFLASAIALSIGLIELGINESPVICNKLLSISSLILM